MNTKFAPLVELRKNSIQKCERELLQIENHIASKHSEIQALEEEFYSLEAPQGGSFRIYLTFEESKKIVLAQISSAQEELEVLNIRKVTLQEQYRQLHIEYEKMKFLDQKARDEILKKLKRKERVEIDEMTMMLYKNTLGSRM